MGDGVVRRTELLGALGAWYLSTKRQPTPAMQVRAGRGVGDKAASSCPRMEGTLSFHTERLKDIFIESVAGRLPQEGVPSQSLFFQYFLVSFR